MWHRYAAHNSALAVAAFLVAILSNTARGQPTTAPAADEAQWRQQMEARMRQLEQENAQLRARIGQVADTQQAVIKDAESRGVLRMEGGMPRPLSTPDFFDINKFAAEGDFPGSVMIPGTKTSFQIGGYVQLDAIFDSDRIDTKDSFVVSAIPTGDEKAGSGNSNFSIRQTRLFLKTQTPTKDWDDLVTYIEVDFFGTDGSEPRIRHAYGQIGGKEQLLAGQTWSAFQDATIFPSTLDFQGPPGIVTSRRPQVRYRHEFTKEWTGVMAIEDPSSEITTPADFAGVKATPYPDFAANLRWAPDWGHIQVSGVLRYLQFDPDIGSRESEIGYGLNITGSVKALRLDEKHIDSFLYQIAGGNGIARYLNDTGGLGLDGVIGAAGDNLEGLTAFAGLVGYQHWWNTKWASTFCYSFVDIDNASSQSAASYHRGQYALVNVRYYPAERVMIGVELLYGIREDKDGSSGDDLRIQFSVQYKF